MHTWTESEIAEFEVAAGERYRLRAAQLLGEYVAICEWDATHDPALRPAVAKIRTECGAIAAFFGQSGAFLQSLHSTIQNTEDMYIL